MAIVAMPNIIQERLGSDVATALMDVMNMAMEEERRIIQTLVEGRYERRLSEEISGIREYIAEMRAEIREEMADMRAEFRERIAALESELRQEIAALESKLRQEMTAQGAELRQEMAQMEAHLLAEMAKRHSELIRWMFIFWIGQFISIAALVIALAQMLR